VVHAAHLRDQLVGLGAEPSRVTYEPLPFDPPPGSVDPTPAFGRWDLVGKRPLVIIGFLSRRKGYDLALEALRHLPPEFVLVAAGGEHAADHTGTASWLRAEAERLGVSERFRITGFLPESELEQAVAAADLVLAPFREMAASASIGFALARGKAVIASDLPENRTLNGVRLFPSGGAAELSLAIGEVSGHPDVKRSLEQAALKYAASRSYERLADHLAKLYGELTVPPTHGHRYSK
jgi:glycosyltransferase involved in cell wall biosynthesis